jgi:toxin-antitoxin system PIN domain toxin
MVLFDVCILVHAVNRQSGDHVGCREWLNETVRSDAAFGVADLVLSGFLRIVTNRKIFPNVVSFDDAAGVVEPIRNSPNCVVISPGPRHWQIFLDLCAQVGARANLVPDAYLAALAIESGSEWITTDRGFARFPGLRWKHPLDE